MASLPPQGRTIPTSIPRRHRKMHISSPPCGAVGQSFDRRLQGQTHKHMKRKHKTNRRIRPLHSPDAFLATRSRSNSTMMLKTCDMSPHRRNIFIDMAPVGLSSIGRGRRQSIRSPLGMEDGDDLNNFRVSLLKSQCAAASGFAQAALGFYGGWLCIGVGSVRRQSND